MADPSVNPNPQQISGAYPQTDNGGQALLDVLPKEWGNVRFLPMVLPSGVPTKLLDTVVIDDPSDTTAGLPTSKTMELVEYAILNFNSDVCVWWGGENVEPGLGLPIRSAVQVGALDPSDPSDPTADFCDSPGTARLKVDPAKVYLFQSSGSDIPLALALVGNNINAD